MRVPQLLACLVALTVPAMGRSTCLLDDYSVQAEYSRSLAVIIGEAVSERTVPDRDDVGFIGGTLYKVKVSESLRGGLHGTVQLFSENTSGRFPMEKGKSYVLFLFPAGRHLVADYCGNSGLVTQKQDVVSAVRALAKQTHHD